MQDASLMHVVDGSGQGVDQGRSGARRLRPPGNLFGQTVSIHKLHAQERLTGVFPDLMHSENVRMLELGQRLSFALEPFELLSAGKSRFGNELQGYKPIQDAVTGLVDHSHTPPAQLSSKLITSTVDSWGPRIQLRSALVAVRSRTARFGSQIRLIPRATA